MVLMCLLIVLGRPIFFATCCQRRKTMSFAQFFTLFLFKRLQANNINFFPPIQLNKFEMRIFQRFSFNYSICDNWSVDAGVWKHEKGNTSSWKRNETNWNEDEIRWARAQNELRILESVYYSVQCTHLYMHRSIWKDNFSNIKRNNLMGKNGMRMSKLSNEQAIEVRVK